ncbi:MAG: hypothetical protein P1V35_06845 [Planctomycetota bacterium]|nr:hypothetical protein [Planctomycetota bacterium]
MKSTHTLFLSSLLLAGLASSCSVTRVDSREGPARIEAKGFVNGHAAVGILAENQLLHMDVFDGTSRGAQFEFGLWKLFRLELGIAGASASVGPLHAGIGVLAYKPRVPRMTSQDSTGPGNADGDCGDAAPCCETEECEVIEECEEPVECEEMEEEAEAQEAAFVFTDTKAEASSQIEPVFVVDPNEVTSE